MVPADFARLASFDTITPDDTRSFELLTGSAREIGKGHYLRHEGSANPEVYWLRAGWLACSVGTPEGGRQITKIHLPGDLVGMPSFASCEAHESIEALTSSVVEAVPLDAFGTVFRERPRLAAMLFMWAQEERVDLMRQLKLMGRMRAAKRLAGFFLGIHRRVFLEQPPELSFELPLTQQDIADATGMSVVHANRGLRELRERGMVTLQQRVVTIHELSALTAFADLPPEKKRSTEWLEPIASRAEA